jgi:hypothetical protein
MLHIQHVGSPRELALALDILSATVNILDDVSVEEKTVFFGPKAYTIAYNAETPILAESLENGRTLLDVITRRREDDHADE